MEAHLVEVDTRVVLVNRGGATGIELLHLAREVQERVRQKFGIALEPEPLIV